MIDADFSPEPVRALCTLALLTIERMRNASLHSEVAEEIDHSGKATRLGRGSVQSLFELAALVELGEAASPSDVDALMALDEPSTPYLCIDIAAGTVLGVDAKRAIREGESSFVGVAILRAHQPEWIFWCPVFYPLEDRRIFSSRRGNQASTRCRPPERASRPEFTFWKK